MANASWNQPSVSSCFDGQTILYEYGNSSVNPDIGGACIAISNILINLLLPFLVKWSSDEDDVLNSIFLLYTQTIPILLATLSSIGSPSQSLTLFDAHFTVAVTASPISAYVASCSLFQIFSVETSLFRKIDGSSKEAKTIIVWLGLAMPLLWLSVSLVTSFSSSAFSNSYLCKDMTLIRYAEFLLVSSMTGVLDVMGRRDLFDDLVQRKGLGLISLTGLWVWSILLVRRRQEIIQKWQDCRQKLVAESRFDGPRIRVYGRLLKRYLLLVWYVPKASWDVIIDHHPTMLWWLLLCLHWSWTLGILNAITFDRQQLSYGQVLSLSAPVPGIIAMFGILRRYWRSVGKFILELPSFVSEGLCFIITGKQQWTDRYDLNKDYIEWSRWRWFFVVSAWLVVTGLHAVWIRSYVLTGSEPNYRTVLNTPHKSWKPFSIAMYCNGLLVTIICIFVSTAGSDFYQKWFLSRAELRDGKHRPRSRASYILHSLVLTAALLTSFALWTVPFFGPFLALPLSQQWHWVHDCDLFSTEIILYGQSNSSLSSTISFYTVTSPPLEGQLPQKQHVYDYDVSYVNAPGYMLLQYRPLESNTLFQEPSIKTVFLDMTQRKFFGCSSSIPESSFAENVTNPGDICSDATGTYNQNPYLFFTTSTSPLNTTFARTVAQEFAYPDDAPSFSFHFANPDGSLTDELLFISAVTKRNSPSILKVCSNEAASAEVLGPLGVFMDALNQFTVYIDHPSLYFL